MNVFSVLQTEGHPSGRKMVVLRTEIVVKLAEWRELLERD